MRRILNQGHSCLDSKLVQTLAKLVSVRAGIIQLSSDDPARWICLVEVNQRRRKAIRFKLLFLRTAQKLSPDVAIAGDLTIALGQEIGLPTHWHGGLNGTAHVCVTAFAFELLDTG